MQHGVFFVIWHAICGSWPFDVPGKSVALIPLFGSMAGEGKYGKAQSTLIELRLAD